MARRNSDRFLATRLKTQHLLLVATLAEQGSVLRAAQTLNLTQPTCTKLLLQAEAAVGARLFIRHARGVEPTEFGSVLIHHARAALSELRHAQEQITALHSGLAGHVVLGTEATSATSLVPRAITYLKQRAPNVTISVELAFSEHLIRRLRSGAIDIAIARLNSLQDQLDLEHETLAPTMHAIAVRANHPLLCQRDLSWRELQQQCWILPPAGNIMLSGLALALQKKGLSLPTQLVETAALPITVALLQMSDMLAPLPMNVILPYKKTSQLAVLPVALELQLVPASIIVRRETSMPAVAAMLNVLREVARGE